MSMSDPLADMITRIRNGQRANKKAVNSPASKLRQRVLDVLEREGYIRGYKHKLVSKGKKPIVTVLLKYDAIGSPVIKRLEFISGSRKRVYSSVKNL